MVLRFRASVPKQRRQILTIMWASTHVLVVVFFTTNTYCDITSFLGGKGELMIYCIIILL